jgi:hypothetical protein
MVDERISVDDDESKIRQFFCSLLLTSNKGQRFLMLLSMSLLPMVHLTDNSLAAAVS